jgi:hypothetical protein
MQSEGKLQINCIDRWKIRQDKQQKQFHASSSLLLSKSKPCLARERIANEIYEMGFHSISSYDGAQEESKALSISLSINS